ncbi:S-layer homology domain-containing protein [Paenibacillus sp. 1P07SE]|uniref:S-layer homology domain-containing protein n=1 Tax=Paenibacillus sp. 1P07SE TaxID=3132209 RepID=UPI0039A51A6F
MAPWANEAIAEAVQRGLMNGVSGERYDPKGETTRAQAAVALYRMLDQWALIHDSR